MQHLVTEAVMSYFLKTPPVDFLNVFVDIHQVVYTFIFVLIAALLMVLLYLPFVKYNKTNN